MGEERSMGNSEVQKWGTSVQPPVGVLGSDRVWAREEEANERAPKRSADVGRSMVAGC